MNLEEWFKKQDKVILIFYFFIIVFVLKLGVSITERYNSPKKTYDSKIVTTTKIGKICYDNNEITECQDLTNQVYKVYLYMENSNDTTPTLHLKVK